MNEFKVGDKVRFVEDFGSYEKGDVVEVINKNVYPGEQTVDFTGKNGYGNTYITRVELVTKKQRITSLEETVEQQQNEINELKVIVHQLRENGLPSTISSVVDKQPPPVTLAAHYKHKSPNRLRAEIIEKAKVFWQQAKGSEFIVNTDKRTVTLLVRGSSSKKVRSRYIAKCNPSDVFNEHIGKAIALGRALGLDVSEFEEEVKPTIPVKGMVVKMRNGEDYMLRFNHKSLSIGERIINDTNAIYSEVK